MSSDTGDDEDGRVQGCACRRDNGKDKFVASCVSHHLRILKDAGIIKMRREGTKNFYYFDADAEAMNSLLQMLMHAKSIMEKLPDRSGE